jgi:hypothetical protein
MKGPEIADRRPGSQSRFSGRANLQTSLTQAPLPANTDFGGGTEIASADKEITALAFLSSGRLA